MGLYMQMRECSAWDWTGFGDIAGVDLDMPDSILTSLDLRNHQKHPKQRKNVPKQKVKAFFSGL